MDTVPPIAPTASRPEPHPPAGHHVVHVQGIGHGPCANRRPRRRSGRADPPEKGVRTREPQRPNMKRYIPRKALVQRVVQDQFGRPQSCSMDLQVNWMESLPAIRPRYTSAVGSVGFSRWKHRTGILLSPRAPTISSGSVVRPPKPTPNHLLRRWARSPRVNSSYAHLNDPENPNNPPMDRSSTGLRFVRFVRGARRNTPSGQLTEQH